MILLSRRLVLCATMTAAALAALPAAAADYPTRPIKVIVPYPPGGSNDILTRLVGDHLQQAWGQPIVAENKPGAAGNLGADLVAKSPPDGYTLVMAPIPVAAVNVSLYKNLPYDPIRDFAPVAMVSQAPNVLVVKADSPIRTVKDLVDKARANPGKLNYATPGAGTSLHLASALFTHKAGVQIQHIPYRGNTAVLDAILKGEVDMAFDSIQQAVAQHKAGAVRALAVTSPQRWPALADVPTMAEAGVPGVEVMAWFTFLAPAKTPPDVVAKLNAEINRGLMLPDSKAKLDALGMMPTPMTPAELGRYMVAERDRWAETIKAANITVE